MTACPTFGSWEEFHAYRFEEPMWRPLVHEVLDRHSIARPARLAMTSSVHVVAIAGPIVVKLYQPLSDGDSWAVETGALRLLGRHGLPVPALLATGELFPRAPLFRWPYCVLSTLAGRPLDERPITTPDRLRIAAFLGDFLRRMHRIQPPVGQFEAPGFLARRLRSCAQEHRQRGILPAHLVDDIDGFLAAAGPLVLDGHPRALTHGDMHSGNVYVDGQPGQVRPVGVLDFNDVRLLDPHYDLVVVHLRGPSARIPPCSSAFSTHTAGTAKAIGGRGGCWRSRWRTTSMTSAHSSSATKRGGPKPRWMTWRSGSGAFTEPAGVAQ